MFFQGITPGGGESMAVDIGMEAADAQQFASVAGGQTFADVAGTGGPTLGPTRIPGLGFVPSPFEGRIVLRRDQRGRRRAFLEHPGGGTDRLVLCPRNARRQSEGEIRQRLVDESRSEFGSIVFGFRLPNGNLCVSAVQGGFESRSSGTGGSQTAQFQTQSPGVPPAAATMSQRLATLGVTVPPQQVMEFLPAINQLTQQMAAQGVAMTPEQAFQTIVQRMRVQQAGNPFGTI